MRKTLLLAILFLLPIVVAGRTFMTTDKSNVVLDDKGGVDFLSGDVTLNLYQSDNPSDGTFQSLSSLFAAIGSELGGDLNVKVSNGNYNFEINNSTLPILQELIAKLSTSSAQVYMEAPIASTSSMDYSKYTKYAGFTATSGTKGVVSNENYYYLVDNNVNTKWCIVSFTSAYIEFQSSEAFIPVGYELTTGNDNTIYTGRNPRNWTIKAKLNTTDEWTTIAIVENDSQLKAVNHVAYNYPIQNSSFYKYFRFEISKIVSASTFQLGEFRFYGTTDPSKGTHGSTFFNFQVDNDFLRNNTIIYSILRIMQKKIHFSNITFCINGGPITIDENDDNLDYRDGDTFTALTKESVEMAFQIISTAAKTCQVGTGSQPAISPSTKDVVTIPEEVNGYTVTRIANCAFKGCKEITGIYMPRTITETIGDNAFQNCNGLLNIYCYAEKVPTVSSYTFSGFNISNAILHVPAISLATYKTTANWKNFKEIVPLEGGGEYEDDDLQRYLDSLVDTEDEFVNNVYRRRFLNDDWQALYVPFSLNYSDWVNNFEVASIGNFIQYDDNGDGTADHQFLVATIVESGSLQPNYPYLIRAKSRAGGTLTVTPGTITERITVASLELPGCVCSFTGNYSRITKMNSYRRYRILGGALSIPGSDSEVLLPYRWYMTIEGSAARELRLCINGEGSTGIENVNNSRPRPLVYTLSGRRVDTDSNSLPKGIYVINNKKCVIK